MNLFEIVAPVAVGAVIGYCTNYIAIKMLFRPRKEIFIGKFRLPFTPGVIPKNQPRIAKAVGVAVSEKLITGEDLVNNLKESGLKQKITNEIMLFTDDESHTIASCVDAFCEEQEAENLELGICNVIYEKLEEAIQKLDFEEIIATIGKDSFADLLSNPMIAMFLNEGTIRMLAGKIGEGLSAYLEEHGREILFPLIREEVSSIKNTSFRQGMNDLQIETDQIEAVVEKLYDTLMETQAQKLIANLDISDIVERKINEMNVGELEDLVMTIMKQELQTVINLGAVIGAVIGIVNIFI